ncbi:hypothetical protein QE152_g1252 [Popillia japonica]|uniref:Uncharacterized protein n=1 Tax=Popillia japonica TaxID=7064 RepID=A0AAW1N8A4_POPJA
MIYFNSHTTYICMVNFQEILNEDAEDETPDDLLQYFTAAAYDVTEHTENVTEIINLKLPETFSLIDKAMEILLTLITMKVEAKIL